jgi:hypothetical protein
MRLASLSLVRIGHVCVVLRNSTLWSCRISQHLRIQPFSHHMLYAFGDMGFVRPDWICKEPNVASSVFDTVPFSLMCPHNILRCSRSLVIVMEESSVPR